MARSRLFFHHFFQGSVPKIEIRPKMRTWILCSPENAHPASSGPPRRPPRPPRSLKNAPVPLKKSPVLSWGPWVPKKAQKRPMGAPPWAWALWALCGPFVGPMGPMWALCGPYVGPMWALLQDRTKRSVRLLHKPKSLRSSLGSPHTTPHHMGPYKPQ